MSSRKTSISALLTMPKPLTVWIIIHCGKFWKIWEYQTIWPASWETYMWVRKQQLELDMEQQTIHIFLQFNEVTPHTASLKLLLTSFPIMFLPISDQVTLRSWWGVQVSWWLLIKFSVSLLRPSSKQRVVSQKEGSNPQRMAGLCLKILKFCAVIHL